MQQSSHEEQAQSAPAHESNGQSTAQQGLMAHQGSGHLRDHNPALMDWGEVQRHMPLDPFKQQSSAASHPAQTACGGHRPDSFHIPQQAFPQQTTSQPHAEQSSSGIYDRQPSVVIDEARNEAAASQFQSADQPSPAVSHTGSAASASPMGGALQSPFASTGQPAFRQGRGNEVWPSQEPMTREESQALGFQDPPTGQPLSLVYGAII